MARGCLPTSVSSDERGRDGLTAIDRLGAFVGYRRALCDQNEYLSLAYGRLSLAPALGLGTGGDALAVKYQKQIRSDFVAATLGFRAAGCLC